MVHHSMFLSKAVQNAGDWELPIILDRCGMIWIDYQSTTFASVIFMIHIFARHTGSIAETWIGPSAEKMGGDGSARFLHSGGHPVHTVCVNYIESRIIVIFIFIYIIFLHICIYIEAYNCYDVGAGWAPRNCRVNPRGFPFYGMGWNGWNLLFHESPVINLCGNITNSTNPTLLRGMFSISRCCNTAEGMRLPASFRLWTARVLLLCPVWWLRLLVSVGHWCQLTSAVGRLTFLLKELQDWPANYQQQVRKTISFMRVLLSGSNNWRQWYVVIYLCFHYMQYV